MRTLTSDVRVLVASDQLETESLWVHCLEHRLLRATAAKFHADPRKIHSLDTYQLVILDIHDHGDRALEISRHTRASYAGPILLFTYEYDERFHLEAYRIGIDESVSKPIGSTLAVAKVFAWLHRTSYPPAHRRNSMLHLHPYEIGITHSQPITMSTFRIDTMERLLTTPEGKISKLSKLECRLLAFLIDNPGVTVSPDRMMDEVWAGDPSMNISRLKNLVYRLRKKIEPDPEHLRYLHTVPGHGYFFEAERNG